MTHDYKKIAVIVAGGSGTRMQSAVPKQFILLSGKPVLMHTIQRFYEFDKLIEIILVLPAAEISTWKNLCTEHRFTIPFKIVEGGQTRFQSVRNGLSAAVLKAEEQALVAIHDGVRPFVSDELLNRSFEDAALHGNSIVCVAVKDSVRIVEGDASVHVDRSLYRLIQTPQTFQHHLIHQAYETELPSFTDDASVAEFHGMHIHLTEGDYKNIKITTPEDLLIAEAFLKAQ